MGFYRGLAIWRLAGVLSIIIMVFQGCSTGGTTVGNPFHRDVSCSENVTQKSCSAEIPGQLQFQAQGQTNEDSEFLKQVSIFYLLNGIDGASRAYSLEFSQKEKDCPKLPKLIAKMNHLKSSMDLSYYQYNKTKDCVLNSKSGIIYRVEGLPTSLGQSNRIEISTKNVSLTSSSGAVILMDLEMSYDLGKAIVHSRDLYPDDYKIYISGVGTADLIPAPSQGVLEWSISPTLPKGLNFNSKTGVLSGTPEEPFDESLFSVTARTKSYDIVFALYLRAIDSDQALIVNSPEDPADFQNDCKSQGSRCTIRGALYWLKNNMGQKELLYIPAPLEIKLDGKLLNLTADYRIIGGQASLSVISAEEKSQIFYLGNRSSQSPENETFYFLNLSLKNGYTMTDRGGAIGQFYEQSSLVVDRVKFENNQAQMGGAINMDGGMVAQISNSIFINNRAVKGGSSDSAGGGAIRLFTNLGGDIDNSIFRENKVYGGSASAVYTGRGENSIRNSIFYENAAYLEPTSNQPNTANGTIVSDFYGTATIDNTVVYQNYAEGPNASAGIHTYSNSFFKVRSSIIAENNAAKGNCVGNGNTGIESLGGNLVFPPEDDCRFNHETDYASAVPNLLSYFGIGI